MRKEGIVFCLALAALLTMAVAPSRVAAASNGDLVQAVGDSKVYFIEGALKRHVRDHDTFQHWGFNAGMIQRISRAELNNHPTGPNLTRVIQWGGTVYLVENASRRYIPTAAALNLSGLTFASLTDLNTDTFFRLPEGPVLEAPRYVRVPGDDRVFYLDGATRRPFKDESVELDYLVYRHTVPVSAAAKSMPVGPTMTSLVNHNGTVWVVMGKKRFYITSEAILLYNNLKWSDLSILTDDLGNEMPEQGKLRPPSLVKTPGNGKIWLIDDDGMRWYVPSVEMMNQWGYAAENITMVPNDVVYRYPEVGELSRLVRRGFDTYYIVDGLHKRLADDKQMDMFNLRGLSIINVGEMALTAAGEGGMLEPGLTRLEGYDIPATTGKVGKEQHLYITSGSEDAAAHYSQSGTPSASQNGMAGGYGSFGTSGSPASTDQERYYINMRWNYADWYEDGSALDSFNRPMTRTRNLNMTAKNWHRHKKVIVTNPNNSRQVVVSIEESGPAFWTGRVSGLSPEAMAELSASTDDTLTYYWAGNQGMSLGRLR